MCLVADRAHHQGRWEKRGNHREILVNSEGSVHLVCTKSCEQRSLICANSKDRQPLIIQTLLTAITKLNAPAAILDVSSIIEQIAEDKGVPKEEAMSGPMAMMDTLGGYA